MNNLDKLLENSKSIPAPFLYKLEYNIEFTDEDLIEAENFGLNLYLGQISGFSPYKKKILLYGLLRINSMSWECVASVFNKMGWSNYPYKTSPKELSLSAARILVRALAYNILNCNNGRLQVCIVGESVNFNIKLH